MNKRERQQQIRRQKQTAAQRKKKILRFGLFALLGVIAIALVLSMTHNAGLQVATPVEVLENDRIKGYEKAPLTLVEYSDFQCPACKAQHSTLRSVWKDIRRQVKLVYRHYPLSRIHPHASLAAHYAEAAGQQGKFWEMHDQLFDGQQTWSQLPDATATFDGYAEKLGLDMTRLKQDMESEAVKDKVSADIASGRKANISGTPTLFLNGEKLNNVRSRQGLLAAIEAAK